MTKPLVDDRSIEVYRFGQMQQLFRGPVPNLRGRYISFLGGSGTFGRFVERPYADLVADAVGRPAANFGAEGAGPGFFLSDAEVMSAASKAEVCVVQVMPASALSNRMFLVRPRRNGRLHGVTELLAGMYPDVDFSRFSYVNGMLRYLSAVQDNRFRLLINEMRNAWIARTHTLLANIHTRTVLFWFSLRAPEDLGADPTDGWHDPNFVDRAMIDSVIGGADAYVECVTAEAPAVDADVECVTSDGSAPATPDRSPLSCADDPVVDRGGHLASPDMHSVAAEKLAPQIMHLIDG